MAYVPMANEHTTAGVLDQIEHQAMAIETTVRIQQSQITTQKQKIAGMEEESRRMEAGAEQESRRAEGNTHAKLYADIGLEMLGGGALGRAAKDAYELMTDGDPAKGVMVDGKKVNTFEDMIKGANRKPGMYAEKPAAAAAGASAGLSLTEKANLAGDSITSQGQCNLRTWGIESNDMPSTQLQQNLVFGHQLASEAALTSVRRARALQGPSMGMGGNPMAAPILRATAAEPVMSLANGPKFNMPEEVGAEGAA